MKFSAYGLKLFRKLPNKTIIDKKYWFDKWFQYLRYWKIQLEVTEEESFEVETYTTRLAEAFDVLRDDPAALCSK